MIKITKKENKQFIKEVVDLLTSLDATATGNYGKSENWQGLDNTFIHNSKVFGSTYFIIDYDNTVCFSVYARFENDGMREKYRQYMGWNHVAEKHNFEAYTKEGIFHSLENLLIDLDINELEYEEYKAS